MNNKKYITAILIAVQITLMLPFTSHASNELNLSAKSAALYEPNGKEFLYEKNANQRLGMASTTKIMTALIALESLDLDQEIAVDDRAIGIDGSSIYLEQDEIMTAEDLIYSLMLRSANDAAEALAYEIAGSIEAFCEIMNERANLLGLKDTNFKNPHGLDAKDHYTTAHDLAIISAEALNNPKFKEISSTYKKVVESNFQTRTLVNHNKLLKMYEGCIGVKTGYTQACGRSLVGAAERDGLMLVSVTIDAPNDWADHKKLLDLGFSTVKSIKLLDAEELSYRLPVINGAPEEIMVTNKDRLRIIYKGDLPEIKREILLPRYITNSVKSGDCVGKVIFRINGDIVAQTELITKESSFIKKKKGFFERIFK